MSDLVRVRLEDGSRVTVGRVFATMMQLEVLPDAEATDPRGAALDAQPARSVDEAAAAADNRTPAQKAADTRARKKAEAEQVAANAEAERVATEQLLDQPGATPPTDPDAPSGDDTPEEN